MQRECVLFLNGMYGSMTVAGKAYAYDIIQRPRCQELFKNYSTMQGPAKCTHTEINRHLITQGDRIAGRHWNGHWHAADAACALDEQDQVGESLNLIVITVLIEWTRS